MMARGKMWAVRLALLACVATAGAVWAQTSPDPDLSWHLLAGGGCNASSNSHALRGTLGQLAIGSGQSANHVLRGGYWYGVAGLFPYRVYLPVVIKNSGP
jgi:hypothetical protein